GDCNVPSDWIEDNLPLGQWVRAQRRNLRRQKQHSDYQIKRLKEIGF
ncbi:MAG: helicase associated domain-containing protein, partial [Candidatus Scalindua sp.]